jgi:cardiolipin synthase A/B
MVDSYKQGRNVSLIVQPGDSFFPIVGAIDSATHSIKMTIFRMDDPIILDAIKNAVTRKIKVQIIISTDAKGWEKKNKRLAEELAKLGANVKALKATKDSIKRYHYKILTVDNHMSFILTFNPTRNNLHYARDFGVSIRDEAITTELNLLFDSDWRGETFLPKDTPLVLSPFNSRLKLTQWVQSAKRTIRILDAKLQDGLLITLLKEKALEGCDVKIIGKDVSLNRTVPNLRVRKLARYKLHAKCIVIDGEGFFIGSQNLREVSLDNRREVGIIIEDNALARRIERVFDEDWMNATEKSPKGVEQGF